MKKLITLILTLISVSMLSSCLWLVEDDDYDDYWYDDTTTYVPVSYTYDFTFYNDTSTKVTDWFVQNVNGTNYALSDYSLCPVNTHCKSTIPNLKENTYTVYFAFTTKPGTSDYYTSDYYFDLNKDVTYYLYSDSYASRALNASSGDNAESSDSQFYLLASDGTKIPLKKAQGVSRL